jgi:hypothetical protein
VSNNSKQNRCIYVVIVTYNMLDGLRKTLNSVAAVANADKNYIFKALVINGNDNDNGHILVEEYSEILFKYVAERDGGIYDAMNKGILLLPDDGYSIFINSDDVLISVPDVLLEKDLDAYFFDVISHDEASGLKEIFHVSSKDSLNASNILRPRLHHQGCFFKNATLKKHSYDLSVGIRADVLIMGTLLKNHNVMFCNQTVALITTGGKSDNYNLNNLLSFFYVGNKLGIGKIGIFIFSFPEIFKYFVKGLIGQSGVQLVRRLKKLLKPGAD